MRNLTPMRLPFLIVCAAFLCGCASHREPRPNLTLLKWDMIAWHDSGAYARSMAKAAEPARRALERHLRRETPQNFAIVFDIDETLLSNWGYLRQGDFALLPETFHRWIQRERAEALAPLREIYDRARAYRIPVFLISGRDDAWRAETTRNLHAAGYWGWSGLFLKPSHYAGSSIAPFKSGVRKMLVEQGYDIILNIGDQDSDLDGGYARKRVKLPNPFYYIR